MSIAALNPTAQPARVVRPALRPVAAPSRTAASSQTKIKQIARIAFFGVLIVEAISLLLNIGLSQSVYQLSDLKKEKAGLSTQTQILGQQVDSLASQENLANAASSLGMIANANPVFLRIADAKVFGKPAAAIDSAGRVAKNNLANAALTDSSMLTSAAAATTSTIATVPAASYVAPSTTKAPQVAFSSGVIPASPTH